MWRADVSAVGIDPRTLAAGDLSERFSGKFDGLIPLVIVHSYLPGSRNESGPALERAPAVCQLSRPPFGSS